MMIGVWVFVVGVVRFLVYRYRFLLVLLTFEFILFRCFVLLGISIGGVNYLIFEIMFLIAMVCAGAYGLSILVYLSRGVGIDIVLIFEN